MCLSLVAVQHRFALAKVHAQLSAILRIYNISQQINTADFGKLSKKHIF